MDYCSVTSTPQQFGNCLAGFQLQELLILKKSVDMMQQAEAAAPPPAAKSSSDCNQPERMALMVADSDAAQSWHSGYGAAHWPEEKPSKLQTLFQISITALAFLSFGGYLLCLIVQAIKSKGTTYFHPVATATTTSTNGNVKRIKIYRRSKRYAHNAAYENQNKQ